MPQYRYKCPNNHFHTIYHNIGECEIDRPCPTCSGIMHRVPQVVTVNWNGLPPHLEHSRPLGARALVEGANERRARYLDTERKK